VSFARPFTTARGAAKSVADAGSDTSKIPVKPEDRRAFADMMIERWKTWREMPTFRPWR